MKKTHKLTKGKHAPARVLDAIKAEINKYIKRERSKDLPDDKDFWEFHCKVGTDKGSAKNVHVDDISKAVDRAAEASTTESIYVEINSIAKTRNPSIKDS